MPKDFRGREVVTAADLEQMTPDERRATFEDSVITDLHSVPADVLTRVRSRLAPRIAQRDREQAAPKGSRNDTPPAEVEAEGAEDHIRSR
jgi:hypothetical protein